MKLIVFLCECKATNLVACFKQHPLRPIYCHGCGAKLTGKRAIVDDKTGEALTW